MLINTTKQRLRAGELVLCMAVNQARDNNVPMIAAACGFHAIFIDMEHSAFSLETASLLSTAAAGYGVTPLVRVASKESPEIPVLLDGGAQGLMIPHVQDAAEAAAMVARCKYPPVGHRSMTSNGPHLAYRSHPETEIIPHMNEQVLLIAMVETPEAVANVDGIAATPGIDAVHIGSRDLAAELGLPGEYRDPKLVAMYRTVAEACRRHGKAMGIGGIRGDTAFQVELYRMGCRYMTIGSDVGYMLSGGRQDVAAITRAVASL